MAERAAPVKGRRGLNTVLRVSCTRPPLLPPLVLPQLSLSVSLLGRCDFIFSAGTRAYGNRSRNKRDRDSRSSDPPTSFAFLISATVFSRPYIHIFYIHPDGRQSVEKRSQTEGVRYLLSALRASPRQAPEDHHHTQSHKIGAQKSCMKAARKRVH